MSSISENRSQLRDFLASIATIRGDLSNITAPPFVLADKSTVEFPQYWAENPSIFLAPASEPDAQRRALLVLKWFLSSLKSQQYAGRKPNDGVKKPLNAFLGELFLGHWDEGKRTTRLISEQVSHHPPVTATILWNDEAGVRAEGYTRQKITFSGSVNIKQIGHAILTLSNFNESFYIPLPSVKVSGILSGTPYPELQGSYKITSTSGFTSEIDFFGKSFFNSSSSRNSFDAKLYRDSEGSSNPLYTVTGQWAGKFTIREHSTNTEIETYDAATAPSMAISVSSLDDQDPWESRNAWQHVISALRRGSMQGVSDAKGKVEQSQRDMRKLEAREGLKWQSAFFKTVAKDEVFEELAQKAGASLSVEETKGIWKVDWGLVQERKKPYHAGWTPLGRVEQKDEERASFSGGASGQRQVSEEAKGVETPAEPEAAGDQEEKVLPIHETRSEDQRQRSLVEKKDEQEKQEKQMLERILRDKFASAS